MKMDMNNKKILIIFAFMLIFVSKFLFAKETTLYKPPFKHSYGINKGTEKKLDLLLGDVTDFDNPQGLAVTRLEETDDKGDKDDGFVTVFGVNSGRGEIIYNRNMTSLGIYGSEGIADGELMNPHGIDAARNGNVVVADTDNNRVVLLKMKDEKLRFSRNIGEGILKRPFDVVIVPGDIIFVTDIETNSIHKFKANGKYLGEIGKDYLIKPMGIGYDNADLQHSRYDRNLLWVIDNDGKRLNRIDYDGNLEKKAPISVCGLENAIGVYLAVDYDDNIYVPDTLNHKIHKFDKDFNLIVSTGKYGTKDELEFEYPRGICLWRRFGQVFISERNSAQYYWLGIELLSFDTRFESDSTRQEVVTEFNLSQKAYVDVTIEGPDGFEMELRKNKRYQQGKNKILWDLHDIKRRKVKPGEYTFKYHFEPTYSARTFLEIEKEKKVHISY